MVKGDQAVYREKAPTAALLPFVTCFWSQIVPEQGGTFHQRVLPDGCSDILFFRGQTPIIAGPATRTFVVPLLPGTEVVAVRFRIGGGACVLGAPLHELLDRNASLGDIWKLQAAKKLNAAVERENSIEARIAALERNLCIWAEDLDRPDARLERAVAHVIRHPETDQEQLARICGLSERHLRRGFHSAVGYGARTLQRIVRLQKFRQIVAQPRSQVLGLAAIAQATGYADQAHLCRETKALAGLTPTQLFEISRQIQTRSDPYVSDE